MLLGLKIGYRINCKLVVRSKIPPDYYFSLWGVSHHGEGPAIGQVTVKMFRM